MQRVKGLKERKNDVGGSEGSHERSTGWGPEIKIQRNEEKRNKKERKVGGRREEEFQTDLKRTGV